MGGGSDDPNRAGVAQAAVLVGGDRGDSVGGDAMNRSEMAEWLCDERLTLATMVEFGEFDTPEQVERGKRFIEAIDLLQGFLCGYDATTEFPPDGEAVFTDCKHAPGLWEAKHDSAAHVWRGETLEGEWEVPDGSPDITRWYPMVGGGRDA